jgi:eukaryotic-like serine/threonine-protein kinase
VTGARWDEVVQIFERAIECSPEERGRYLDEATGGDPELRTRVMELLRGDEAGHPLFDATPAGLAAAVSDPPPASLEGRRVGAYTLVRRIGRGGMSTVYQANDLKHRRTVALKLLDGGASSALGGERFRREIEVVAQLQHPHILPLYDSGEVDGLLFFVMPLVSGGTLRDRIARDGQLPIDDVCRIARHVAAGLDYAHRHAVVHRDVKPANVLLEETHAAISDFGIAHSDDEDLTKTGVVVGTPAYMSPEQATESSEIDARSDVYSLACVVFEMLTGEPPFRASNAAALVAKHVHAPIPSARTLRPSLSPHVDEVLARGLAKKPAERFASATALVQALETALDSQVSSSQHATSPVARPAARTRRWWFAAVTGVIAISVAVASTRVARSESEPVGVAVLPFVDMSSDSANEYFSDGVTEELTGALAQLGRLRVTPRTTAFAYKGRSGDLRRIGDELDVSRIVEGSVRRDGDRVIFVATLYDARSGDRIWSDRYERAWGTVLSLQSEIAGTIAEQLRLSLLPADRTRLAERHTVNADAYDSYLKGRYFFEPRTAASLEQALVHFQRALAIDSTYARAHAGLADSYSILAWTGGADPVQIFPIAERAARQALALDSSISEAHVSLGIIHLFHTWDWLAADRAMTRAIELDSTSALAWFWKTWALDAQGRTDEALVAIRRARQLDPRSLINNARIGTQLTWMGQLAEAERVLRATLEMDPSYPVARVQLARVLSLQGRHDEAQAALPPDSIRLGAFESGIAGFVYARAGRRDRALAAARALESRSYVPAEGLTAIYAGLGDIEKALTWLERGVDTRAVSLCFLAREPMYDALRSEPRYRRIAERLRIK